MPCRDDGAYQAGADSARRELDVRTAQLCELCRATERAGLPLPAHLAEWWRQHQQADMARHAEEAAFEAMRLSRQCRRIEEIGGIIPPTLRYQVDEAFSRARSMAAGTPNPERLLRALERDDGSV